MLSKDKPGSNGLFMNIQLQDKGPIHRLNSKSKVFTCCGLNIKVLNVRVKYPRNKLVTCQNCLRSLIKLPKKLETTDRHSNVSSEGNSQIIWRNK